MAGRLDDAAVMFCTFGVDNLGTQRLQSSERPFLIGSDQARIPRHIGREDRRQPTLDTTTPCRLHGSSPDCRQSYTNLNTARIKRVVR